MRGQYMNYKTLLMSVLLAASMQSAHAMGKEEDPKDIVSALAALNKTMGQLVVAQTTTNQILQSINERQDQMIQTQREQAQRIVDAIYKLYGK